MRLFFRKKKEDKEETEENKEENNDIENSDTDEPSNSGDKDTDAKDVEDGVPRVLKDKLAEIRDQEEPGYEDVEVKDGDDDTNENKDDKSTDVADEDLDEDPSEDSPGEDTPESEDVDGEPEFVEIDPRLVEAGHKFGFSDDKIRTIAEADESILADLADQLDKKDDGHREDKDEVKEDEVTIDEVSIEKLREKMGDEGTDILLAMQKENDALKKRFTEVDDLKQSNAVKAANEVTIREQNTATEIFDANAKTFKELGVTEKMQKYPDGKFVDCSELKVRQEIYKVAKVFQSKGGTFEAAMKDAMQWYAGAGKEKAVGRKLVKEIKKNGKRFTVKPNRRKGMKRVFKDPNAHAVYIVKEAKRKAGIGK